MPKRTERFKLAYATGKATQLVGDVLREIPTIPIFSKPFRNAQLAVILVTALLAALHHPVFAEFSKFVVTELWNVIIKGDKRPLLYAQTLVENYHALRIDENLQENWDSMLDTLAIVRGEIESSCVLQHILDIVLEKLLKMRNEVDLPILEHTINVSQMSAQEGKSVELCKWLHTICNAKALQKMVNNVSTQKFVDLLSTWSTDGPYKGQFTFLEYTTKWLQAQNRGCLFQPNAQLYLFFHACENETRKHLNTAIIGSYRDINLNELLFKKISTSYLIQQYWANLVDKNLSCAESAELFKVTINYFVSIRVRAFVLVYTDFKKLTDKAITKKGTRSLRQQLSK